MTKDFDILVVGAGIMGMASAYHLKANNRNKGILIIDRFGSPGQGNTGRSNALFRNTFTSTDNQLLADTSIEFYLHVQNALKADLGLQLIGYLWLLGDSQLGRATEYIGRMRKNGIRVREYSKGELKRLIPEMVTDVGKDAESSIMRLENVDGALFGPKCGRLDPDKLVRFYAGEYKRIGGSVAFGTNVERLIVASKRKLDIEGEPFVWQEAEIEGVEVKGNLDGEVRAKTIVIACGAWENELLEPIGIDGHVKAKKRQLFSISAKGNPQLEKIMHTKGFNDLGLLPMTILPTAGVHFKPVVEENDFWVACEDDIGRPFENVPKHDLDEYNAEEGYYEKDLYPVLKAYFPQFAGIKPKNMWAGLYAYNTIDYTPFVFSDRNLIVVGGDSGSGIMKGDALGRIVDAVYRQGEGTEASLFGDVPYRVKRLGFRERAVEREEWVL